MKKYMPAGLPRKSGFIRYLVFVLSFSLVTVFLKPMSYYSLLRVHCDEDKCIQCKKCVKVCPVKALR